MYTTKLAVRTAKRVEFVDITDRVSSAVAKSGVRLGICMIFVPHTTAGLTINENADPSVKADIIDGLADIVPAGKRYRHAEGNADAHIKAGIMGSDKAVPIEGGLLKLGTWQGIYFCEFDGPRSREVWISAAGA